VQRALESVKGLANFLVPRMRHVQTNDYNINKLVEKVIREKQQAFLKAGKTVGE
jgi:hypothetical protein